MKNKILNEHFLTLTDNETMFNYIDIVWDILQNAYKEIGGFLTAKNKNDLIKKSSLWKLVRKNGIVVAVAIYSSKYGGRKLIAGGAIETIIGKDSLYSIIKEDIKMMNQRQAWCEVSGKMEHIYNKFGGVIIPSKYVQEILKDKEIYNIKDDGHYTREIKGVAKEKIMFGWIDPEIKEKVDSRINESYCAIDDMKKENKTISIENIDDKKLRNLFYESGRIISNCEDNGRPLRMIDRFRLKELKNIYLKCLNSDNISIKNKDYCEIEIEDIEELLHYF